MVEVWVVMCPGCGFLGFLVQGLVFRVQTIRLGIYSLRFGVSFGSMDGGLGFRVWALWVLIG